MGSRDWKPGPGDGQSPGPVPYPPTHPPSTPAPPSPTLAQPPPPAPSHLAPLPRLRSANSYSPSRAQGKRPLLHAAFLKSPPCCPGSPLTAPGTHPVPYAAGLPSRQGSATSVGSEGDAQHRTSGGSSRKRRPAESQLIHSTGLPGLDLPLGDRRHPPRTREERERGAAPPALWHRAPTDQLNRRPREPRGWTPGVRARAPEPLPHIAHPYSAEGSLTTVGFSTARTPPPPRAQRQRSGGSGCRGRGPILT